MKQMLKKILAILIVAITIMTNISLGVSSQDSKDLQDKIDKTKEQLNDVNTTKTDTEKQVDDIQTKIDEYQGSIDSLNDKLDTLNTNISENEKKLEEQQKAYDENSKLLDERLVTIYENGSVSYIDLLLSSTSLTEFISNYYLISELASYDLDLLEQIQNEQKQIEETKKSLENDKAEVETLKSEKEVKTQELNATKQEKEKYIDDLEGEAKDLQADLAQFEKDKAAIDKRLEEIANANKNNNNNNSSNNGNSSSGGSNSSGSGGTSSKGYICPIPGLSKANITCGYYGYSGHGGADFGGNYGKPVVAAKSGTVVISETLTGTIPNYDLNGNLIGKYRSYGEYIAILHDDGNITLYAHGKPGSRLVKEGQRVSQGKQIMTVGNTGNVSPRPTPSNPKGGAHLHFEVRVNGSQRVDPAKYLP